MIGALQFACAGARSAAGGDPEERCTFSPAINPASERLLEDSATVPSGGWLPIQEWGHAGWQVAQRITR